MARTRKKSTRKKSSRKRSRTRRGPAQRLAGWVRRLWGPVLVASFVAGVLLSIWLIRIDRVVTMRFEGRPFRVPSRVLSAPTVLYPGLDWQEIDLRGMLPRLGFREVARSQRLEPGQYHWGSRRLYLYVPALVHPTRGAPARRLEIGLRGGRISEIRAAPRGKKLGAVLLEPELVGFYYGPDREQRELVRLDEIPPALVDAILAVEDQRFPTHPGVDARRIVGALIANLEAGSIRQGGSTLTQQLVKNFFLEPERTLSRKLQEAAMALIVEWRYDKAAILNAYLNEIYLGQRGATAIHGMGEASRLYFGKRAADLELAECALLAAIIQSPNAVSPYRNPERAVERRNLVLHLMHQQGRIDRASWQAAKAEPLLVAPVTPDPRDARYFLAAVRRQLPDHYDRELLTSEGLRIHSTLDLRLQMAAATALREGLAQIEKRYPRVQREDPAGKVQGCLVALRPQTGEVLALVGGRDFGISQFDRCTQARRPAGSVFKPFVYIAALERAPSGEGITLASFLSDEPLQVSTPAGVWSPLNYDKKFHGSVDVRTALERSFNVATARLGMDVGIEHVVDVARRLGIESELPEVPSLALGTGEVSPIEMARAYATLANGGVRPQLRAFEEVVDESGALVERRSVDFQRVLDPGTAYLATSLLQGVIERGTGKALRRGGLKGPVAGKTGTTDDERDAWFVGFTPELVVAVWVGFDEPQSLGLSGSSAALPIWARFVEEATGGSIRGEFLPPPEVERVEIDPVSGARALSGCPRRRGEYFLLGTAPTRTCPDNGYVGSSPSGSVGAGKPSLLERLRNGWGRSGV